MAKSNMTARERIAKARINLLTDYPFWGSIAMHLVPREVSEQESEQYGLKTMAVDNYGNLIYYAPWVLAQSDAVMKCGMAHEVMHVVLKHLQRLGSRDQKMWNIAVDAAVNEILSHTFTVPSEWVRIQKMAGKAAEEIYDWILRNAQTYKCPSSGGFDSHIFGGNKDGEEGKGNKGNGSPFYKPGQTPVDVPRVVKEAYNFAKSQGKLPAGIDRMFADILNPVLDWKDILRKYLVSVIPHDFSYTRPHKKSYSTGFYMPMVKRENIELCIGVDSSGSISDQEYAEFLTEILSMCRQFEALKATVLICDADIQQVEEITENFDPYSIHGRGYGGTSSLPVFEWIEKNKDNNIKILVYFTDGYIDIPQKEYPFPTLWIVTAKGRTDEVDKMVGATVVQIPNLEGGKEDEDY